MTDEVLGPRTDQIPTLRNPNPQVSRDEILARVLELAEGQHTRLPQPLRDIAIDTATEALLIPEDELLNAAGRIDAEAITSKGVSRIDYDSGSLLAGHDKFRKELLRSGYETVTVDRTSLHLLRLQIASRTARAKLAEALGMSGPGQFNPTEDFARATDLVGNAVGELRAGIYQQ